MCVCVCVCRYIWADYFAECQLFLGDLVGN